MKKIYTLLTLFIVANAPYLWAIENDQLRCELLQMVEVDQRVRKQAISAHFLDQHILQQLQEIDQVHTQKLQEILKRYAWFSDDLAFQEKYLVLLEQHEGIAIEYAYLYDRIAMHQNRNQRYGTQAQIVDGKIVMHPIEDAVHVDQLRRQIGLEPLEVYMQQLANVYGITLTK